MRNFKKLVSIVLLVMFTMSSGTLTVTPAVASPSGGLVQITDFSGGNGGFSKGNSETIYFGSYWQNTLKSDATDKRNPASYEKTGIKWLVLSTNAPLDPNDASKTGVLLLSDQILYGAQFNSRWRTPKDTWNYGRKQDIAEGQANEWVIRSAGRTEGQSTQSDIRETLNARGTDSEGRSNGFAEDAFSDGEYGVIAETTHIFGGEKLKGYYKRNYVSSERIFLLSYDEAIDSSYGFSSEKWDHNSRQATVTNYSYYISMYGNPDKGVLRAWWLRSPAMIYNYEAARVTRDGKIENRRGENVGYGVTGVRPALNLNPESILFLSAAEGGKGNVAVGEGFKLDNSYDGSKGWKMTLLDAYDETTNPNGIKAPTDVTVKQNSSIGSKTVDELAQQTIDQSKTEMDLSNGLTYRKSGDITVAYTGKDTEADFVSAIAATGDGTADNPYVYENYAKISNQTFETGKSVSTANLDSNKEYTLFIFAEKIGKDANDNTNYMTDYASETQKFKINDGKTTYVGKLSNTYQAYDLTAKLGSNFNLSFYDGEYMTGVNAVGNSTITAGSAGTTLKGKVDIAEGAMLTTVNAFTFKGDNTIDGTLTGANVTLSGGTTTVKTNGKIENNLTVAGNGTLSLTASKYGVDDGVKNVTSAGGTIELTGTGIAGVLGKHITNGGKVVLSTGTSFAEGVKIIGGNVELKNDVEFSAANLVEINNLAAPTTANEAAIYNFGLKIVNNKGITQNDQINLTEEATGHIKLGDVVYLPGSSDDTSWTVNESRQVQYLSSIVAGTNIVIDNTLGVAMPGSDGASYFFSQAYDPNDATKPLIGYLNVKRGNTYTLWEVVGSDTREDGSSMSDAQKKEARSVNIYTLNVNGSGAYVAGKDFTALKAPGATTEEEQQLPRELTIKGLGAIAFKGNGSTTGIIINSLKNLVIDGVTEISDWANNTAFTLYGGDLKFTGDNTLNLKNGITNTDGLVVFDQNINLTGKLSGTGNYINNAGRTLTVEDASNIALDMTETPKPEFNNNGILNLGDDSATAQTLGTPISYVPDTTGEATLNFNGSGTITATETIKQKVVNVNTNLNMSAETAILTADRTNIADGKNLTIGASNLNSNVVANGANQSSKVTLKGGILGSDYTITGGAIVIDGAVTASADNLMSNKGITNANTLTLNGGKLIDSVYGADGTLKIGGTVEIASDKTVENKVVIDGTNTLTANANSLTSATAISNASGTFKVTGGTIFAGVTGTGTTEIGDGTNSAEVTLGNNASIAGNVAIKAQSKFIADFTKLGGAIDNTGMFVITGSTPITIDKQITGAGTTQFGDGSSALAVTFGTNGRIDDNAKIAANSQLTLSDFSKIGGDLTVDANGKLIITANGPINKEIKGLGTTQIGDDSNHVDVTLGDTGSIFGDVAINADSMLTVENFMRLGGTIDNAGTLVITGTNTIDWKILGATGLTVINTAIGSDTVKIGKNGVIQGRVALNNGELQLSADKYGTDIKLNSFVGGTLHFTDGLIVNDVVATGASARTVILDSGVSLSKDVEINGGVDVVFNEDVEFIAGNLANIKNFTSNGAKYTFGANILKTLGEQPYVAVDKITLDGEVTTGSTIKLENINLTGSDEGFDDDSWKIYTWKTVQYIEASSLNDVSLEGEITATLSGGGAYTFQQGYEVNPDGTLSDEINPGYVSIKRGNAYTLAEVVGLDNWEDKSKHGGNDMTDAQRQEARGVDIYTLKANNSSGDTYSATHDLGEFQTKTGELNRSLLVRAFSDSPLKFLGDGHAAIRLNKTTDVLEVRNISEISGWKNAKFAENNGTIKFTGGNPLVLSDKITGNGITQIGDVEEQGIITKVELKDNSEIQGRVKILDNGQLSLDDFSRLKSNVTNDGTIFLSGNEIATVISSSGADVKGTLDLQKAAKIAADINNQNIILREGDSKVDQASYITHNDLTFNGGGFDFQDDKVSRFVFDDIILKKDGYLKLDVDLASQQMDIFDGTIPVTENNSKLHITALKLLTDAKQKVTNILFTHNEELAAVTVYEGEQELELHVKSHLQKYTVAYDEKSGEFTFTKIGVPEVSETTKSISDTAQAIGIAWLETTNNLQKRLGELRSGEESNTGWVRFQRSLDDLNNDRKLNVSGNLYQIGYDFALNNNKDSRDYFGLSLERFDGTQSFAIGNGDLKSTTLGAYYTKIYDSGHYFDFIFRYGRYESDSTSYDNDISEVTKLDYALNGVTLSGEYGYRANIGKNGLYLEPQAEFIYGYLGGAKKTSSTGILTDIDSTNHFVTRLGLAFGQRMKNFNYYLRGSYYHDFAGSTNITYGDTSYKQDGAQNWWEVSLGGGWNLTDTSYFYAELTKHFKDVSNSLNFNLGFRFTL